MKNIFLLIIDTANSISKNLRKDQLVILESTVYPGVTIKKICFISALSVKTKSTEENGTYTSVLVKNTN